MNLSDLSSKLKFSNTILLPLDGILNVYKEHIRNHICVISETSCVTEI